MRVSCWTRQDKPLKSVLWHRIGSTPTSSPGPIPRNPPRKRKRKGLSAHEHLSLPRPAHPSTSSLGTTCDNLYPEEKKGWKHYSPPSSNNLQHLSPQKIPRNHESKKPPQSLWDPLTPTTSGRRTITEEGSIPSEGYGSKATDAPSINVTWEKEEQRPAEALTRFQEKESTPPYDNNRDHPTTPQRNISLEGKTGAYQTSEDAWYTRGRRWQTSDRRSLSPYGRPLSPWVWSPLS